MCLHDRSYAFSNNFIRLLPSVPFISHQAAEWWRKAAALGNADADSKLDRLKQLALATPGMPVVVTGLAARPELNGRSGTVQAGAAIKPGRILVLLDGGATPMAIREANVRMPDGLASFC